jgi:acetate kinase
MGGVDALIFTAGVGEHACEIRESICDGLQCLGLELDLRANATCRADAEITRRGAPGRILVVATQEDATMLREVLQVLGSGAPIPRDDRQVAPPPTARQAVS